MGAGCCILGAVQRATESHAA